MCPLEGVFSEDQETQTGVPHQIALLLPTENAVYIASPSPQDEVGDHGGLRRELGPGADQRWRGLAQSPRPSFLLPHTVYSYWKTCSLLSPLLPLPSAPLPWLSPLHSPVQRGVLRASVPGFVLVGNANCARRALVRECLAPFLEVDRE